jgi:hypothetical protein
VAKRGKTDPKAVEQVDPTAVVGNVRPAARSATGEAGFNEPLPPHALDESHDQDGPPFVWVRYAADEAPRDGLEYVSAVDGQGPGPAHITEKAILEDVKVLERAARKLRRFVNGIANHTVEVAPPTVKPVVDEATREKARRALAKSGFVRVSK